MEKLRFDFCMRGTKDGKSNILCLTSLATPDGHTYAVPEEVQPITHHRELIATDVFVKVKNSIKKRNQFRKVWIPLTQDISDVYLDAGGNLQFDDYILDEITDELAPQSTKSSTDDAVIKLLQKLIEDKSQKSEIQNLSKIAKDFMIEKFSEKNLNAHQWIQEFEKECARCMVTDDKKIIEILKFFLEKAGADWYSCMLLKFTVDSEWELWKKNFSNTFGNKGWSPTRYAYAFKYQAGSLLDYALKKEKLLLSVRKSMDTDTLIDLIAVGLPNSISDKIDRETLNATEDLYNELGKLEYLAVDKEKKQKFIEKKLKKPDGKTPCPKCEKEKRGKRYHLESDCWFNEKNNEEKNKKIRNVNNSELEVELNNDDTKN